MSELQSPARLASAVYAEPPGLDDPAELYHEASKLGPSTAPRALAGAARLAVSQELRRATVRASLRHPELPLLPLDESMPLAEPLGSVLARRRSARAFGPASVSATQLAALLDAAYGLTGAAVGEGGWTQPLRAAPSGGALYPLDLYVEARRVDDVPSGLHRFDPLDGALETGGPAGDSIPEATAYPELARSAALTVVLAATFWRSRVKYGLRAYRFALLEAGHVGQNLLLAATALDLASVPLGGFYDHRLDDALGLDGVNRASLYVVCVGARSDAC
jgi:SagB-type dehydrogenase family enzyme